jgi:hypothetical protein
MMAGGGSLLQGLDERLRRETETPIHVAESPLTCVAVGSGRSLEEWLELIRKKGPKDEKAQREWLKAEHGLGTNSAWWLAERAAGKGGTDDDPEAYLKQALVYVETMYSGGKAPLRPIYDELLRLALGLGPDAKACPCQTMVPLYRQRVFAEIKPSTKTRIDLGFALGDMPAQGRLIDTGGFAKKDRITHRIPISEPGEIDAEVRKWLKAAYDLDAR